MKQVIAAEIGPVQKNKVSHHVLDGSWSLYELIEYIIDFTGPVDVFLSSYSISEAAICSFENLMQQGSIRSLECLLDTSLRKTRTSLLFFLHNIASLKLTHNHSKIILLKNDQWTVAVNASANMSRNRRVEAMIMDTNPAAYDYYAATYREIFANAIPLLP